MREVVRVRKSKEKIMLSLKIRKFFNKESLNIEEEMYLLTKKCSCVACKAYTCQFQEECPKDKLAYLNYISRP